MIAWYIEQFRIKQLAAHPQQATQNPNVQGEVTVILLLYSLRRLAGTCLRAFHVR